MNINLELLQILDEIDRCGSFEAAANKLHKVRSALTYTIKKTEDKLGIQIFDRSKHRAELTTAGRVLLERGRQLLILREDIEKSFIQVGTGWEPELRIAYDEVINTSPLFDLIRKFQHECPFTNIEFYNEVLGGCADALMSNRADIAIGISGPLPSRSDLMFESIGKNKFVFVVSPAHPIAKMKEPISTETIKKYYAIIARDSSLKLPPLSSMTLAQQPKITFSTLDLKKKAQIEALGVGYLPYSHVADDIKNGRLILKKIERTQPVSISYLGWSNNKKGKAQQWIMKHLRNKSLQKQLFSNTMPSKTSK